MSRFEKLLSRILLLEQGIRYEEIKKILTYYGYEAKETRGGSSHVTFRKPGEMPITLPRHGTIKKGYVEMVRDVVLAHSREEEK
ncbi:MAG: type II toxin-antitoxin system HicA family toxin [Selenomonas sp.]|jgi:predicted RNA binding protein YcfA (HicA-like mRNA interferase family)|nr:type II toxin-antitoxin system HicA family toxin [Selenomonas sp.]MCI7331487.1 type II toxin-antitoxin system HicA family toxin [Selenomonadaceae bacterium]MDD6118917.1 type II toxin-antitoxin system HicA family toxin [Selenomonadaceae bacterium]MDD7056152.1 type II toxin-antitoxin system HicA family toxin [Selenomonadaceae bacterium]MDY3915765.1 type II toxin-antitoxin system HicA family toxin [Selenomonadaceae bacterium]